MITAFASFYAISNLKGAAKQSHDLFEGPYQSTNQSVWIRRDLVSVGRNLGNAIMEENPKMYKTIVMGDIDDMYKRIEGLRGSFKEEQQLIDTLESSTDNLKQEIEKVFILLDKGDYKGAVEITKRNTPYFDAYDKCVENSATLNEDAEAVGIQFDKNVQDTASKAIFISTALSVFSIVAGLVICGYITKKLKQPIEEIEIAANKMADGDFDITINYESEDELGILSNSMRQMSNKTKEIINDTVRVLGEVCIR